MFDCLCFTSKFDLCIIKSLELLAFTISEKENLLVVQHTLHSQKHKSNVERNKKCRNGSRLKI